MDTGKKVANKSKQKRNENNRFQEMRPLTSAAASQNEDENGYENEQRQLYELDSRCRTLENKIDKYEKDLETAEASFEKSEFSNQSN